MLITETRKKANLDYKPLTDVIVGKDEILVNRKESAKAVIEKQEGLLIVDTASRATVLSGRFHRWYADCGKTE